MASCLPRPSASAFAVGLARTLGRTGRHRRASVHRARPRTVRKTAPIGYACMESNPPTMKLAPLLRGTWPVVVTPTLCLLLVIAAEELNLPSWLALALSAAFSLWAFAFFIRTQFARRKRDADIRRSWPLAVTLSLVLLAAVLSAMWFNRSPGPKVSLRSDPPADVANERVIALLQRGARPNPSLKAPTPYGSHRLAATGHCWYRPCAASRRPPSVAA